MCKQQQFLIYFTVFHEFVTTHYCPLVAKHCMVENECRAFLLTALPSAALCVLSYFLKVMHHSESYL